MTGNMARHPPDMRYRTSHRQFALTYFTQKFHLNKLEGETILALTGDSRAEATRLAVQFMRLPRPPRSEPARRLDAAQIKTPSRTSGLISPLPNWKPLTKPAAAPDRAAQSRNVILTARIVRQFVQHNPLPAADLPGLIGLTFRTLSALVDEAPSSLARETVIRQTAGRVPAVPISQSVKSGYLVCLDDGLKFKMLKGHLRKLGMTPEQYRERWGLPRDYPMVAVQYSVHRSAIAKSNRLGQID